MPSGSIPGRLYLAGGGGELFPLIQGTESAAVTPALRRRFEALCDEMIRDGARSFGEMAILHFSLGENHGFHQTPADHPLFSAPGRYCGASQHADRHPLGRRCPKINRFPQTGQPHRESADDSSDDPGLNGYLRTTAIRRLFSSTSDGTTRVTRRSCSSSVCSTKTPPDLRAEVCPARIRTLSAGEQVCRRRSPIRAEWVRLY